MCLWSVSGGDGDGVGSVIRNVTAESNSEYAFSIEVDAQYMPELNQLCHSDNHVHNI